VVCVFISAPVCRATNTIRIPFVLNIVMAFRRQIKEEESWKTSDRNAITIFKTNGMRIVLVALHTGAEMKTHTTAGIISVQVLEGKITFTTEQQTSQLSEGQMLALHAGIPHRVFASREAVFLLTLNTSQPEKRS